VDFWALLGDLPVPLVVHDLGEGAAARFVNPSFTRAFGYTLEDVPSVAAWAERAYPDPDYRREVLARWWAEIAARQATGTVTPPAEYRIRDKAGRPRDVLIGFALQGDLAIATFQDLTEARAAEAALEAERRQHEQTAFALTENMPAGAFTMLLRPGAALAEFAFVSKQFLQMLELTREEAVGDPMTGFSRVHPEDRPRWLEINAAAFAGRQPFSGEARIVANGETRWIRAESVPRALDDGSVIWEGILVDIDDLKRTEKELTTVLEAARAYTWRRDLRARRSAFDGRWAALAGPPPGEHDMPSDDWILTVHPEDVAQVRAAVAALEAGAVDRQILTYRRRIRDGAWIWLQVHAGISARDAEGRPTALSGVSFDITAEMAARAQAQEELAQLREDLQRAHQRDTVAQVAGGVAHDLNNLIAVVAGTAEMMELQACGQPGLLDGLGRIRRSVGMARDLIAGLGGLVRPDLPREAHDLGKLLRDAVALLGQRRIVRHAVRVELADGPSPVWANPTEVAQVIVNLALNACDAGTPERPATVTLTSLPAGTAVPAHAPDAGVAPPAGAEVALFTISDTGTGITDEVRARMFRPNFTTKGRAAPGLGLRIVSTILQANRAALWVDSAPGGGSAMTVAWPAAAPAVAGPAGRFDAAARADGTAPAGLLRGLRVLVVDDLSDVAEVLADMLEAAGAVAVAVSDPEEAAEVLAEAPGVWSALVTDLHMDGMDGRALASHAGSLSPPVPTVLVTARPDAVGDTPATGFAAVLSKPVTAARLRGVTAGPDLCQHRRAAQDPVAAHGVEYEILADDAERAQLLMLEVGHPAIDARRQRRQHLAQRLQLPRDILVAQPRVASLACEERPEPLGVEQDHTFAPRHCRQGVAERGQLAAVGGDVRVRSVLCGQDGGGLGEFRNGRRQIDEGVELRQTPHAEIYSLQRGHVVGEELALEFQRGAGGSLRCLRIRARTHGARLRRGGGGHRGPHLLDEHLAQARDLHLAALREQPALGQEAVEAQRIVQERAQRHALEQRMVPDPLAQSQGRLRLVQHAGHRPAPTACGHDLRCGDTTRTMLVEDHAHDPFSAARELPTRVGGGHAFGVPERRCAPDLSPN
jgi:PAS domain S-box-containing protein